MVRGGLGPKWVGDLVKWVLYGALVGFLASGAVSWWLVACGVAFGAVERIGYGSAWAMVIHGQAPERETLQRGPLSPWFTYLPAQGALWAGVAVAPLHEVPIIMNAALAGAGAALVAPWAARLAFGRTPHYWKIAEATRGALMGITLWITLWIT